MSNLKAFETEFKATFPKAWYRIADFYGHGETVFWSGEDCFNNDGKPLFDYNGEFYPDEILPELVTMAEKHGYYFECYDAGTYILTEF